jgi:hypothetical protein
VRDDQAEQINPKETRPKEITALKEIAAKI